jgi:succinate dehydrogenase / fumarate reductase flavoprotein subunit
MGYNVKSFCFQDSPRAHSIAAQGELLQKLSRRFNFPLVLRYCKGGDYRSRANVHRLAEVSVNIIDQCVMQGVPWHVNTVDYLITVLWRTLVAELLCKGQTGQQ